MKLWLVRHAEAVEAASFHGTDLERPLTPEGRRSAQAAFMRLASLRRGPEVIVSSEAVRAWETARILAVAYGRVDCRRTPLLNPGCRFKDIRRAVAGLPSGVAFAALVGHEPDFSQAVSRWTSGGALNLVFKKGAVVELELDDAGGAALRLIVPPDLLGG